MKEGWGGLINSRNAHFFRDGKSLCCRWACFGEPIWESNQTLGARPAKNSGTCVKCWEKREKEESVKQESEG